MRKLLILLAFIVMVGNLSASFWVIDFNSCPQTYQSQTCITPTLVCGYSAGITYCANPATIIAPASTATSNTDQDGGSYNGGYLIDCYAFDSGTPYCNNEGSFWCDRNSTCYTTKHKDTTCTANVFGMSSCGSCRSGYGDCGGDDACETQYGVTACSGGANNNVPSCSNCNCNTNYHDCDAGGNGTGNGCEIHDGDACTIGGLSGTYLGCSGGSGNCVVPASYFITGSRANYSTSNPLLWGKNYGLGWLINFSNSTDSIWGVNQYGCISFPDTTTQCTASSGGVSYYANITDLQTSNTSTNNRITSINGTVNDILTSNTSIWTQLGLISSNFTSFTTSNTSIWNALGAISNNFTSFTTSNTSIWNALGAVSLNFTSFTTSNTSIWNYINNNYVNVSNLQSSNGSIYTRVDTLNTSIQNLITSNNSAYTRTNTLNITIAYINGTQIPGLVPYTGATNNVTLGNYNMTASNYSVTGSPGYVGGNSTCFWMNFNSTVGIRVGSACG